MQKRQINIESYQDKSIKNDLVDLLNTLPFEKRREMYGFLVQAASNNNPVNLPLQKEKKYKNSFFNDIKDEIIIKLFNRFNNMIFYSPSLTREIIWSIYEEIFKGQHSKKLGQYFTPNRVARLVLTSINPKSDSILDPMAGHGIFLKLAQEKFDFSNITGVEIDPLLISASKLVLNKKINLINSDFFEWAAENVKKNPDFGFSAIVGNPAYISYQNLNEIGKFSKNSQVCSSYRNFLFEKLRLIAEVKGMDSDLSSLFEKWSGYSDLSSFVLILSWLLTKNNGQISFVMSNHWMERDYGIPIREFLVKNGNIRCIINHQKINWFTKAQIPTSIVVIKKVVGSKKQNNKIPYIEITDSNTEKVEDLKAYLDSAVGLDFWEWVDSLENPGKYGPLEVSLVGWYNKDDILQNSDIKEISNLKLPYYLENTSLCSFKNLGWNVHQGLRTGCNEVFYVYKDRNSHENNKYFSCLTKKGKKTKINLEISDDLVLPAIQKLQSNLQLKLDENSTNTYLLDLRNSILPEDKENIVKKYPSNWIKEWNLNALNSVPENLAEFLSQCGEMTYERGRKGKIVKELTAVKPNIWEPKLDDLKKIPNPPRFWYQLPLSDRHFGKIIISRVNDGPVRAYLIDGSDSIITDANFVTLISNSNAISAEDIWIWFNSNTFRIICELNGVSMGGGALKVETSLVSKIPIPKSLFKNKKDFSSIIRKMKEKNLEQEEIFEIGKRIDSKLFNRKISEENEKKIHNLIIKRKRSK